MEGREAFIVLGLQIGPPVEQQPRDLEMPADARLVEGRLIEVLHAHGEARTSHAFAHGARRSRRVRADGGGVGREVGAWVRVLLRVSVGLGLGLGLG